MPLLLHAITTPAEPRDLPGVQALEISGLAAWVSELPSKQAHGFTKRDLLAEHQLVDAIFERVEACLPARFPTLVEREALWANVAERRADLERRLARVRGCCELAVAAAWTDAEDAPSQALELSKTPGRSYLLERQARWAGSDRRHARATQLAEAIERAAGAELVDAVRNVCPSASVALSMALLVKRIDSGQVLERLPRSQADVRILLHGPWPPYSFAGAGSDAGDGRRTGTAQAAASARTGGAPESN